MIPDTPETIIVELRPYREPPRTHSFGAGLLLGLAFSAFVIPIIVNLIDDLLTGARAGGGSG